MNQITYSSVGTYGALNPRSQGDMRSPALTGEQSHSQTAKIYFKKNESRHLYFPFESLQDAFRHGQLLKVIISELQ